MGDHAILLYDAECGFCRWSVAKVLAWDRRRRLRPVALQTAKAKRLLSNLSEEQRMASWHLIEADGTRSSAGAAVAPLLRLLPGCTPLARIAETLPGATIRGYAPVARHRGRLGRLIPAGAAERAQRRIRHRTPAERTCRNG